MIDLALLRILKYREQFNKVERYIPSSAIDKKTKAIVEDIRKYFESNEEEMVLDFPAFRSMFFTVWHKGLKDEDCAFYNALLTKMEEDVPDSVRKNIINQLLELEFVTDLANVVTDYEQGEEIDAIAEVSNLLLKVTTSVERQQKFEFAAFTDETVGEAINEDGYEWPLEVMNKIYRNILGGDQYIVAARPGKGKTTFLTQLNWKMAQRMSPEKVILWFNNESRKERIMSRQIQSALYATNKELFELKRDGKLQDAYKTAMGRLDRVRVYDVHGKNNVFIEDIIESVGVQNIGAIIFDMLDNVKFPLRTDAREDQRLEQLYQWSRELGVRCNCPVFPTSQVSNEGAGLLFPTENMLKDSKTGKQGACDGIIMIGSSDDPLKQQIRGLSMPKTKSKLEGEFDMREEVHFDADRGRYV